MNKNQSKIHAKNPIDVLRSRFWYEGIKQKMGFTSAYQLEQFFERQAPKNINELSGSTQSILFRNKWSKYALGINVPKNQKLLRQVENHVPGSTRELNHPLWKILKLEDKCVDHLDQWFQELEPQVQAIIYRRSSSDKSSLPHLIRQKHPLLVSQRLIQQCSLDALAALFLYWQDSIHLNKIREAEYLVHFIYRVLLMLGMEFCNRQVAESVFELFRQKVFERMDWQDRRFAVDVNLYFEGIKVLELMLYRKPFSSWTERCRAMARLLDGKHGFDIQFGLGILLLPNWRMGPPTIQQWDRWHKEYKAWLQIWISLRKATKGRVPNDALWHSLVEWIQPD